MKSTFTRFFRLTIRELLVLSALIGLAVVALRAPTTSWWWLSSLAMAVVLASVVVAVTGQNRASRWSRGFVLCLAAYGAMVHFSPRNEMSPTGWLPTTAWLAQCEPDIWSQETSSDLVPSFPESEYAVATYPVSVGDRESHYRMGHLLVAIAWALLGGRLAICLDENQESSNHP